MKNKILKLLLYVATFIVMILIFNVTLYLACSFKSDILRNNVVESYETLDEQGMFLKTSNWFNLFNNNCTDSVIINEAYSVDSTNPYISYMKARKNYQVGLTEYELEDINGEGVTINYDEATDTNEYSFAYDPVNELGNFLRGKLHYSLNYGRYWHGYLLLYRPLLIIFNLSQIRTFLLVSLVVLLLYFEFLLCRRFGKNAAIIIGMSLILSGYLSVSVSLESSSVFLVMIISSIVLLKRIDKIKDFKMYLFIIGCVTNFVDYLTVPLITLGMLMSIYLLKCIEDGKTWKECLKTVIYGSLIWLLGYAGTWLCKWILYDITIDGNVSMVKVGFEQSFYRMQRVNENVGNGTEYINTIYNIISRASLHILLTLIIVLVINKFKLSSNKFDKVILGYILIALMPIVWYAALANHTVMHYYFTYRQSLLFMIGNLLAFDRQFLTKKQKND